MSSLKKKCETNYSEADVIALGALGAWTIFEPDLLVALVAANLDFRKNFEAPVQDRPVNLSGKKIQIQRPLDSLQEVCSEI